MSEFIYNLYQKFKIRLKWMLEPAKRISLPGFEKMPVYDVMYFFVKGIMNGAITTRASSIAFNFFIAVIPAIIFIISLIPYIPVNNFQEELINLTRDLLPSEAFEGVRETFEDLFTRKKPNLLSFGFILALIFSTNGISALIDAFNATSHSFKPRSAINKWLISVVLVFIFSVLIITATLLIIFSGMGRDYLINNNILESNFTLFIIQIGKWLIIIALLLIAISFLYFFAPARKEKWKFLSPGSITATFFVIVTSLAFSYYVSNFGTYNKFYGSLGTVIIVLLWMYLNAIVLIIGFELNASISNVRQKKEIEKP
ncbi:YihY/virulence factor BrkB family protein [Bacteroidota bacterium]